jgi:aerobic-type carbon monoxide dehydrogenase small subunit (CoxS/CutS family)
MPTRVTVNGIPHEVDAEPAKPMLWVLREELGLTGTKFGCGIGQCGACTVVVDGRPVRACVLPLSGVGAGQVQTIEGLDDALGQAIKRAWIAENVPQCGYCQPGQIAAAYALLKATPNPDDAAIEAAMTNICRCGTYPRIRAATKRAAADRGA